MDTKNNKLQKASRIALVFVRIVQVILVVSIAFNIYAGVKAVASGTQAGPGEPIVSAIQNILTGAIVFAALFIAAGFLKAIRLEHSPFTGKNISRLKTIALLIAVIEPLGIVINLVGNALRPVSPEGIKTVVHSYAGGMLIVLGLIIYCIALSFEHGTCLQKQSDETL